MDEKLLAQMRERKKLRMKEAIRRTKDTARNIKRARGTRAPTMKNSGRKRKDYDLWKEAREEVKAEVQPITNRNRSKGKLKQYAEARAKEPLANRSVAEAIAEQEEYEDDVAKRELAQRALCRKRLLAYVLRFNEQYLAGWVHKDICTRLERFMVAVERGESPRLMIQMPPRHGKSTLASQEFPSWVLGHHPNWEIMSCSYAESLALDFSRAVRERLRDPEYHVLFPKSRIDKDNQNAKGWKTSSKGGLQPAGVEGPLTGKGAHILIIDDPVKNATEAESEITREGVARWYETTAYTRLAPGGGVLVIQTRWHLDDLSGRLEYKMNEGRGDQFEIVRYPAQAVEDEKWRKVGDPLHPARYNSAQLKMIKQAVGRRTWAALYQQNPVPDEGAMFQSSMIQYYNSDQIPEELTFVTCWDLAIGQKEVNDRTVGMTWGKDITGDYWFVDCRRGHWDAYEIVEEICDQFERWEAFFTGLEKDKIAMAVGPYLDTEIENRELFKLHVEELPPAREGNKQHRARSLQGLMRRGRVWLPNPEEAPWVSEFVSELLQFPYGRRDDHVDVAAWLALQAADTPAPGFNYSRIPRRDSWRDRLRGAMRGTKTMMSS
jgi:predicted phage terminase large subunit-like protein